MVPWKSGSEPDRTGGPDSDSSQVELHPDGRLDKDTYRMGEPAAEVLSRFEVIAEITAGFKALA